LGGADDERPGDRPYGAAMPLGREDAGEPSAVAVAGDDAGLRVDGVSVRFEGLTALEDVSLRVEPGQVVGVIGPNGAGKTTLFNVICGFVRADDGEVRWRGRSLRGVRPLQLASLGIARTLQGIGLFGGLTAIENVMTGGEPRRRAGLASALFGLPRSDRDERELRATALGALDALGVADVAERMPDSLPYPVQKRVGLARALVADPELILLDEPAGGLGGEDMAELGERIRSLRGNAAVLLVEHHMDLVMSVCDRVTVLDFGRRIADGTPEEIRRDEAVVDAYLGIDVDADG
jgi:branched-chain amino acid transport system ATP-binding protein